MLRHWVRVAIFSLLVLCPAAALGVESPPPARDPLLLYGHEIRFDVERDGTPVGQHVVTFTRTADGVRADSRADINVELFWLSAYRFRYQSRELWRDGELQFIEASTNRNGDYTRVQAVRDAAGLEVSSPEGTYEAPPVPPTSYWNAAILSGGEVFNTLNGEVSEVQIVYQGLETVATRNGSLRAHHYHYSGDIDGEIWFDNDGRWVKLRFPAKDGSTIDYICRRCQAPTSLTEAE
jgi:hypothetical protein